MKRTFLLLCCAATLRGAAAEFPLLRNTNSVNNGTEAPPLTAAEALAQIKSVPAGFKASVFASEPDVQNAIQLTWDTRGRMWVAENYTMDSDRFVDDYRDRIVILEGADGGSKLTSRKVFTDDIKNLMGFALGNGGVWVMASPQILFIPDRNADGVPDGPAEVVYDGFNATGGNMHTSANGLEYGIDGWIYGRTGHAHLQMVGPPGTPSSQRARLHGSLFRFHPQTRVFEALASGTVNPWGQDWDKYGEHFFDSTIVGPFWYSMPGAKFVSSSAEPNQKAYELIDQIGNFDFRTAGGARGGGRGAVAGGAGGGAAAAPRGGAAPAADAAAAVPAGGGRGAAPGAVPTWAAGPWNNGHAMVGMMIYQGDNWPADYRDRMFAINLFGHRTVVQDLERSGSGYVAKRAPEPDLFEIPDPWFRGMDIVYGPDGGVFISDWTDTGDYHNRTGENRLSGRIYKITYGDAKPSSGSNLYAMTVEQLVALNTHANEWFPRMARQEFSNRLVDGRGIGNAKQLLRDQFNREADVARKLRSLWTLYVVGGTDEAFLLPLLKSSDEHMRVWGIRLLTQHWPIDALHTTDSVAGATGRGGGGAVFIQQRPAVVVGGPEVAPSSAVVAEFNRMAAQDPSSLVRLVLASTMQRMPFNLRPAVATGLLSHKEDATDKNLPLMTWYALIPLGQVNPSALSSLGTKSELRATSKYIARRLAEDIKTSPGPVNELIVAATNRDETYQSDIVDGLTQGLQGQQGLTLPVAWDTFSNKVHASANAELVAKVRSLDVVLGSTRALAEAKRIALDAAATPEARKASLQSLLSARAADLRQVSQQLLEVPSANAVAATALASFNDPTIGPMLVAAYPKFAAADLPQLIAALASRPAFAGNLLDALAAGKIKHADVSATDARQIRSLNDAALTKRLGEIWGEVRDTPEAKLQLLATYKAELTAAPGGRGGARGGGGGARGGGGGARGGGGGPAGAAAPAVMGDRSAGRVVFASSCAVCHTLFGEGGKIGPDITGGQKRRNLDTLLAKVVDPNSELPLESRLTVAKLKDGRTVAGMVANRTASTLTLKAIGDPVTIALSDISSTELAPYSLMPEGLLEGLDATQRRNLVAYLMGDEQAPLPTTP